MQNGFPPTVEGKKNSMFFFRDSPVQPLVGFTVSGIKPVVTDHFEMFFRDVLGQTGDKVKDRNGFCNEFVIFMPIVVKRDGYLRSYSYLQRSAI